MNITAHITAFFLSLSLLVPATATQATEPAQLEPSIDWQDFLGRHDLLWSTMPKAWNEAPFMGNGMLGAMVMQQDKQTVRWEVGRGDVQDHRPAAKKFGYDTCRLPIGHFELKTVGKITGGTMRLDLWNAQASGEITTSKGSIRWQSFVHAEHMVIVTQLEPSAGEQACSWQWQALPANSPRQSYGKHMRGEYQPNPSPQQEQEGACQLCIQPLNAGGGNYHRVA